jgi:ribosomal subunit interface protein
MIPITITHKDTDLGQDFQAYLEEKLERLEKYAGSILSARAIIRRSQHHHRGKVVSLRLLLETTRGSFTAETESVDARSAVDIVQEKLEQQLRHQHQA